MRYSGLRTHEIPKKTDKCIVKLLLLCIATQFSFASPVGTIVQIVHRVPMGQNSPAPIREFYVDLGLKHGIKEGETLVVSRTHPVLQAVSGQSAPLIRLSIGEATVVRSSDFVSLARLKRLSDPSTIPNMNYTNFMLGDQVAQLRTEN